MTQEKSPLSSKQVKALAEFEAKHGLDDDNCVNPNLIADTARIREARHFLGHRKDQLEPPERT